MVKKGLLTAIGYFLSPLSWWNDLYVNFPIAYGLAWLISLSDQRLFAGALMGSYWFTNILGLILLHKGLAPAAAGGVSRTGGRWKNITIDVAVSLIYTGAIVWLLYSGALKLPQAYFGNARR